MVKHIIILIAAATLTVVTGCSKKVLPSTLSYRSSYDTECLSKDATGAVALRVWGVGTDSSMARDNAARKAVEEVIFAYLSSNTVALQPILAGPTTRSRHREYFNKFFKGTYKKYIKTEKPEKEQYNQNDRQVTVPVVVVVDREGLIDKFQKDKITDM